MKNIYLLILLALLPLFAQTQSKIANEVAACKKFKHIDMTSRNLNAISALNVGTLTMSKTKLASLVKAKPQGISITLPKNARENVHLKLVKANILTSDFVARTSGGDSYGSTGIHYRGIVTETGDIATLSIFSTGMIGNFNVDGQSISIQGMASEMNVTKDTSIIFTCGQTSLEKINKPQGLAPVIGDLASKCVRVYLECDYALYLNKGSVVGTVNWITSVYNNVAALYANESISTKISEVFVWTTPDAYSKTSSYEALIQFKNTRPAFNGDLAHLTALGGQNLGGIAWVGVLCATGYNYAYSNIQSTFQSTPNYSWTVEVMTHEMGHNLGSNHSQSCSWVGGALDNCYTTEGGCPPGPAPTNGGTIMSYCHLTQYGINFNNGFGKQPGDKIRAEVAAAPCLVTSCDPPPPPPPPPSCDSPSGFTITNVTSTSAKASWQNSTGATKYFFEFKHASASTWNIVSTELNYFNLPGTYPALIAGQQYNARVKSLCGTVHSGYSNQINFITPSAPPPPPPPSSYCVTKGLNTNYEHIKRIKIGTIDRTSGKDAGYYNGTALISDALRGSNITLSYQQGGTLGTMYWRAWIDYNGDNDFDDAGEMIISRSIRSINLLSSTFTIPTTAKLGNTRLRVSMKYGSYPLPCGNFSYGEVEDVTLNIK